jgi:acetyl-CoA synthetase
VIWRPSEEVIERANVTRLMRRHGLDDYWELVRRSQEEPEWFWAAAVEDMGLEFAQPWTQVLDVSSGPEWATWFVGGKLNIAWNCVHRWARGEQGESEAAVWEGEDGTEATFTFRQLSSAVTRLAETLVRFGVEPGDRVAIYLPMSPEVARVRAHRRHPGTDLLRVRRSGSCDAAPGLERKGADHGGRLAPPGQGDPDEGDLR